MRKFFTLIIMMVCTLILLTACGGTKYTYDAADMASFRLNADGTVTPYVDSSMANKIAKECSDGDMSYISLSLLLNESCKFTVEPNENVKAGDTVKATFEYDKKALKEYGISFTNTTFDYVMEGSLNTETVNIQTAPTTVMTTEKAVETEPESEAQAENVVYEEYDVWNNVVVSCVGNTEENYFTDIFINNSDFKSAAGLPKPRGHIKYRFIDEAGNETDVLDGIAPGTKLTAKAYATDDFISEINKLGYTITPSTREVTLPNEIVNDWTWCELPLDTVMTTEKNVETEPVVYEEYDVWDNIFVSCAGNSDNNEYNEIFANFSEINYPAGFPKYVLAKYVFVDEDGNETDVLSHIAPGTKLTVKAYPYDDMLSEINKLGYTITPSTRTVTLPADVADKWYELSLE